MIKLVACCNARTNLVRIIIVDLITVRRNVLLLRPVTIIGGSCRRLPRRC